MSQPGQRAIGTSDQFCAGGSCWRCVVRGEYGFTRSPGGMRIAILPQQLLHEQSYISSSYGYGLDVAANDVPIGHGNNVRNTIAAVHHSACQCSSFSLHVTVTHAVT